MVDSEKTPECTMATDICDIRNQIDHIDDTILDLINRRLNLAKRIGELKKDSGNRVVDSTRESEILRRLTGLNKGPLNPNVLHHIFIDIIAAARAIQASQRVAYLGPEATFTHLAATSHFGYSVTYVPSPASGRFSVRWRKGPVTTGWCPWRTPWRVRCATLWTFFSNRTCVSAPSVTSRFPMICWPRKSA
jgi:chorismate mutase/prephenate dehydratase